MTVGVVYQRSRGPKLIPVGLPPFLKTMKIWPEVPRHKPEELDQQRKISELPLKCVQCKNHIISDEDLEANSEEGEGEGVVEEEAV